MVAEYFNMVQVKYEPRMSKRGSSELNMQSLPPHI